MNENNFDIEIINTALKENDNFSWKMVYNFYFPRVKVYLIRKYSSYVDVQRIEDFTQDAFMRLATTDLLLHFEHSSQFFSYLCRTAENIAKDFFKKKSNDQILCEYIEDLENISIELDNYQHDNKQELIKNLLEKLPEKDRIIIEMRIRTIDPEIIAETLSVKPDSIRMLYKRAVEKLKKILQEYNEN